ncbi:MAG: 3'(2'),5'-bisphosphate nucleotidase CysQ [Methylocystaceae bacterium]|nr:MAG: 3'(2'),5'-bisphosphate nucleotidase CysQ [Methylocystaceae bacterium]
MPDNGTAIAANLPLLEAIVRRAGDLASTFFRAGAQTSAAISYKEGGSPVTEADMAVDRFLLEHLRELFPDAGWLSEETADSDERLGRSQLIVVDPIDGTYAFSRGDTRWAVSVALVEKGRPVLGVIHAPALEATFVAAAGQGAFLNGAPIRVSAREALAGARVVAPRGLAGHFARSEHKFDLQTRTPSLALRLADIASGRHDLAIAAPNSRDWDIAAADVILTEAGGVLSELEGLPLGYNRKELRRDMLVAAPQALFPESLALARAVSKGSI